MHGHKTLKERIRAAGLRATPGRLVLAGFLEHVHQPIGTPALTERFVPSEFDLATLYRMLKSFEEKKLVREVTIDSRFASYEWVENENSHHHHLVCKSCGLIVEIPPCDLKGLESRVLAETKGFGEISSHSLEFFGLCRTCLKKK
jgi:Fur family ferric uptake transcriptional regulator